MQIQVLLALSFLAAACSAESPPAQPPAPKTAAEPAPAEPETPAVEPAPPAPDSEHAEHAPPAPAPEAKPSAEAAAAVARMKERTKEIWGRAPNVLEEIEVQHVLVGYAGAPRIEATRTKAQAEELAAEILARVEAGEDFSTFFKLSGDRTSNRTLKASEPSSVVGGFWHVAWRLEVGELGVMPYHGDESPYGWHVIKRVR